LGTTPNDLQDVLQGIASIPTVPSKVAVGVPAESLRRRPDVRLAESQMAAQSPLIGVAKADLFPHFALFGSIGLRSSNGEPTKAGGSGGSDFSDIFDSDSIEFFGGPTFSWDIFNYGRIKNRVRVQDARLQQLVVNYRDTVLRAAQETEDALAGFLRSQEEEVLLSDSVAAAKRSVQISLLQYREGMIDYQRVLDTQRAQAEQEDILADTRGSVALNLIAIYKALGGGWEIREGKDFVPEKTKEEMQMRTNWGDLLSSEK
jgi:outer membrane protein TolC